MYLGLGKFIGNEISDIDHIHQCVSDILLTPLGSRVELREYGSFIPELIDQPVNPTTIQLLRAATVMAINRWENRIKIETVSIEINGPKVKLAIDATRVDLPKPQRVNLWMQLK